MATARRCRHTWAIRHRFQGIAIYVYASVYECTWIGIRRLFMQDGTIINLFGIGVFIGNEVWWRLRRKLKRHA